MEPLSNEQILAMVDAAVKGVITTSTVGSASILNPTQLARYVRALQESTVILPEARLKVMTSEKDEIDRVGFLKRILGAPKTEGTGALDPASDGVEPDFTNIELVAEELQGIVGISDRIMRRNLEKQGFENTLVQMIGEQCGIDIEDLALNGDEDGGDDFYELNDGWLKLAEVRVPEAAADDVTDSWSNTAAATYVLQHTYLAIKPTSWNLKTGGGLVAHDTGLGLIVADNASGITGTINYKTGRVTLAGLLFAPTTYVWDYDAIGFDSSDADAYPENMFDAMLQVAPPAYMQNRAAWRFYVPWSVEDAYRNLLKARGTALGDEATVSAKPLVYKGIPVVYCPRMPEIRSMLANPNNLIYGVFHEVQLEREREAKLKRTDFVVNTETDYAMERADCTVVAEIVA
jgi:hypothetical protein